MRLIDIIKSASLNLKRNKGRTILTIVAVFIGAFTIALTTGINVGVNDYIDKQISSVGNPDQLFITKKRVNVAPTSKEEPAEYQEYEESNQDNFLGKKDLDKIKKIDGLTKVEAMQSFNINYIQGSSSKKFVFPSTTHVDDVKVESKIGRNVDNQSTSYEIELAPEYVKSLGYKKEKDILNQEVNLGISSSGIDGQEVIKAKVVGVREKSVIQGGMSLVNKELANKAVLMNESGLPEKMQGKVYGVMATSKSENLKKLRDKLDKDGYQSETIEEQIGMIKNVVNAITGVLTMFGAIALLAASFGIINTLYMSVQERTKEIGLMKAMGMGKGKIFLLFSLEALLIGFWGSILGVLGAMGVGKIVNSMTQTGFLEAFEGLELIAFNWSSVASIMLLIMLIGFLAGTLPAKRAAKLNAIDALRYE